MTSTGIYLNTTTHQCKSFPVSLLMSLIPHSCELIICQSYVGLSFREEFFVIWLVPLRSYVLQWIAPCRSESLWIWSYNASVMSQTRLSRDKPEQVSNVCGVFTRVVSPLAQVAVYYPFGEVMRECIGDVLCKGSLNHSHFLQHFQLE